MNALLNAGWPWNWPGGQLASVFPLCKYLAHFAWLPCIAEGLPIAVLSEKFFVIGIRI